MPIPAPRPRLLGSLGLTEIVAGKFEAALADYTESRARFETAKSPEGVAHAWVGIGFSHAAREKFADAIPAYRTAIRMFEAAEDNLNAGRAWLGLSIAQSGARRSSPPRSKAREKVRAIAALQSRATTCRGAPTSGSARRCASCRTVDEARRSFQDAVTTIDRLAADAPINPEARRQLDDSASAWSGPGARARLARATPRARCAAVEARHAHIRRVQLGGFQRDITRGATPEERAEEQGIVRELISTRAQLTAERRGRKPDAGAARQAAAAARDARGEARRSAGASLRAPARAAGSGAGSTPASTDWLASLDSPADLLVEYLGRRRGTAGRDGRATARPVRISPRRSRRSSAAISPTRSSRRRRPRCCRIRWSGGRRRCRWPRRCSTRSPRRLRDRDRIVVVPDDVLWKVPFEALPSGDADLSSRARVTYATSLATLARRARHPRCLRRRITSSRASPARPRSRR